MFIQGKVYRRLNLHVQFGGQQQGGISTPARHPFIMLFTGGAGDQYGYRDTWTDDGLFFYSGEGQRGDMSFVRGNAAIRNHAQNGKDLHLFEYVRKGEVRYVGQMVCSGFHESRGPDLHGSDRRLIVFELTPADGLEHAVALPDDEAGQKLWQIPLLSLRARATAAASATATPKERLALYRYRSHAIKVYAQRRADGVCEACGEPAPFRTSGGRPYLETHHIHRLSDGGPDDPESVAALCPNCHRRVHHGEDGLVFNKALAAAIGKKEKLLH